jgi:hypothetical protein
MDSRRHNVLLFVVLRRMGISIYSFSSSEVVSLWCLIFYLEVRFSSEGLVLLVLDLIFISDIHCLLVFKIAASSVPSRVAGVALLLASFAVSIYASTLNMLCI